METADLSTGISSFVRTAYNSAGQTAFTSFPYADASTPDGISSNFDGLGRPTLSAQTVAPFAQTLITYHAGHRRRVKDAANFSTDYYTNGYEGPGGGDLIKIAQPMDVTTEMTRNIWGEMTRLRQHGTSNEFTNDISRYYYYNAKRQVCRYRESEGGNTVYLYDAAGQMISYQQGLGNSSACTAPTGFYKVNLSYDDLGQLIDTNFFHGATADIHRVYDANGNLTRINRGSGATAANWTYAYDSANNLKAETLRVDGRG